MNLAEPLRVTSMVVRILESKGIPYFIGGSLASSLHGIPRATHDVDLVADIADPQIPDLVQSLQEAFYIDAEMIREAIRHKRAFNLIHLETMFKIDVFIMKSDAGSQEEMARRQAYTLSDETDATLFVASAEDIVIQKLIWYQQGGGVSARQWTDVLGVLQVRNQDLDWVYLNRAAEQNSVMSLLRQAQSEVDSGV